jgi:hypothetical protein
LVDFLAADFFADFFVDFLAADFLAAFLVDFLLAFLLVLLPAFFVLFASAYSNVFGGTVSTSATLSSVVFRVLDSPEFHWALRRQTPLGCFEIHIHLTHRDPSRIDSLFFV